MQPFKGCIVVDDSGWKMVDKKNRGEESFIPKFKGYTSMSKKCDVGYTSMSKKCDPISTICLCLHSADPFCWCV